MAKINLGDVVKGAEQLSLGISIVVRPTIRKARMNMSITNTTSAAILIRPAKREEV